MNITFNTSTPRFGMAARAIQSVTEANPETESIIDNHKGTEPPYIAVSDAEPNLKPGLGDRTELRRMVHDKSVTDRQYGALVKRLFNAATPTKPKSKKTQLRRPRKAKS